MKIECLREGLNGLLHLKITIANISKEIFESSINIPKLLRSPESKAVIIPDNLIEEKLGVEPADLINLLFNNGQKTETYKKLLTVIGDHHGYDRKLAKQKRQEYDSTHYLP